MTHKLSDDAIVDSLPYLSLPKQPVKPDYTSIQDTHRLLTNNVASINNPNRGGENGHIGLILVATQYALIIPVPFIGPTNPGQTPTIPA